MDSESSLTDVEIKTGHPLIYDNDWNRCIIFNFFIYILFYYNLVKILKVSN
jgi:hypothetical protein